MLILDSHSKDFMLLVQSMTRDKNTAPMADNLDLILGSYDYDLPAHLVAARPASPRHQSKLLVYEVQTDKITHSKFFHLDEFLPEQSKLIFNQSKVFPCRLLGHKRSGGKVEIFILSLVKKGKTYPCMIRASGTKKIQDQYVFEGLEATLKEINEDGTFYVEFHHPDFVAFLAEHALIPIPPYIREGKSDEQDKLDYQTVYANHLGSVAAPTAGLHFTEELFTKLEARNIERLFVTLHVGAGTFAPVKSKNILEHKMHEEIYSIDQINAEKIKASFGHWIPVGTTSLRTLQSCIQNNQFLPPDQNEFHKTSIFLHPGKKIYGIKGLITNFHLPQSSLIMLVSTLIGREKTLKLYEIAIKENYRFFSYGDGMLILL